MKRKQYTWELPASINDRLGETTYGRQRAIYEDEHLLLILHSPPDEDDTTRTCVVFLRQPDGEWFWNGRTGGEARLRKLVKGYHDLFEKLDDQYEGARTASDLFDVIEPLTPLARASANMSGALQSAREFIDGDAFLIAMRDEGYGVARNYELLLADAKLALDFRIAQNAERQSRQGHEMAASQHKLNLLAAVTFPLMAVATLFGMNLIHGFENASPMWFWVVLAIGVIIGMYTQKWVTRTRK